MKRTMCLDIKIVHVNKVCNMYMFVMIDSVGIAINANVNVKN